MPRVNKVAIEKSLSRDQDLFMLNYDDRGLECVAATLGAQVDCDILPALIVAATRSDALATLVCESGGRIVEEYPEPQKVKDANKERGRSRRGISG